MSSVWGVDSSMCHFWKVPEKWLTQVLGIKLGRRHYSEAVNGCANANSQVFMTNLLSIHLVMQILTYFSVFRFLGM